MNHEFQSGCFQQMSSVNIGRPVAVSKLVQQFWLFLGLDGTFSFRRVCKLWREVSQAQNAHILDTLKRFWAEQARIAKLKAVLDADDPVLLKALRVLRQAGDAMKSTGLNSICNLDLVELKVCVKSATTCPHPPLLGRTLRFQGCWSSSPIWPSRCTTCAPSTTRCATSTSWRTSAAPACKPSTSAHR